MYKWRQRIAAAILALPACTFVGFLVYRHVRERVELARVVNGDRARSEAAAAWLAETKIPGAVEALLARGKADIERTISELGLGDQPWTGPDLAPAYINRALDSLLWPPYDPLVAELLADSEPRVRAWAAKVLGRQSSRSEGALVALARATRDEDFETARWASEALLREGRRAAKFLVDAIPIEDAPVTARDNLTWEEFLDRSWTYKAIVRLGPNAKAVRHRFRERIERIESRLTDTDRRAHRSRYLATGFHALLIPLSDEMEAEFIRPLERSLAPTPTLGGGRGRPETARFISRLLDAMAMASQAVGETLDARVFRRIALGLEERRSRIPIEERHLAVKLEPLRDSDRERRVESFLFALDRLGPRAESAIPRVVKLADSAADSWFIFREVLRPGANVSRPEISAAVAVPLLLESGLDRLVSLQQLSRYPEYASEIVPAIEQDLMADSREIRCEAARTLRAMGELGRRTTDATIARFGKENRVWLAEVLSYLDPTDPRMAEYVVSELSRPSGEPRLEILRRVGAVESAIETVRPKLRAWLGHGDSAVRLWAAAAFCLQDPDTTEAMRALEAACTDQALVTEDRETPELFRTLEECGERGLDVLARLFESSPKRLHEAAFESLHRMNPGEESLPVLRRMLGNRSTELLAVALHLTGKLGVKARSLRSTVEELTEHSLVELRELAFSTLGKIAPNAVLPRPADLEPIEKLLAALETGTPSERRDALLTLAWNDQDDPRTLDALLAGIRDPSLAYSSSRGLVGLGARSVDGLMPLLEHPSEETRSWVAYTLGRIGIEASASIPALVRAARDEDWVTRANAIQALGRVGRGDERARDAVLRGLLDLEGDLRWYAIEAKARLQSDEPIPRDETDWLDIFSRFYPYYGSRRGRCDHRTFCTRG